MMDFVRRHARQVGQEVRLALTMAAQTGQPFSASASRVLNDVLGRDVQASVWATDGSVIARSEGFYFPEEEKVFADPSRTVVAPGRRAGHAPGRCGVRSGGDVGRLSGGSAAEVADVCGGCATARIARAQHFAESGSSMRRELARLSRLVDDLLVLARLDALGSAARGRDVCLEACAPERIVADGERLHQVLLNLLANAVEHTPTGGKAARWLTVEVPSQA